MDDEMCINHTAVKNQPEDLQCKEYDENDPDDWCEFEEDEDEE